MGLAWSDGRVRRRAVAAMLGMIMLPGSLAAQPASAPRPPGPVALEALIKSTLLSFNDANVTGNYTVFHARLAAPFRDQFSAEKLKEVFRSFSQQNVDFDVIAALKPILTEEPKVDERSMLLIRGHFETSPNRVTFALDYMLSDGDWKLFSIHVKVRPPGE